MKFRGGELCFTQACFGIIPVGLHYPITSAPKYSSFTILLLPHDDQIPSGWWNWKEKHAFPITAPVAGLRLGLHIHVFQILGFLPWWWLPSPSPHPQCLLHSPSRGERSLPALPASWKTVFAACLHLMWHSFHVSASGKGDKDDDGAYQTFWLIPSTPFVATPTYPNTRLRCCASSIPPPFYLIPILLGFFYSPSFYLPPAHRNQNNM